LPILNLFSQSSSAIRPLSIGDTVPDITFNNIINYKSSTAKLSDFKGKKVVILDFFATWCGPCVKALPHLDSLQNRLNEQIQVFVVDYESKATIQPFLQQNSFIKGIRLPFITSDSVLKKTFPHRMVPHEIWIDKNGKIQAITSAEYVTLENIKALVAGVTLHLPEKKDVLNYSRNKPLLDNGNGGNENLLLYRGVFTKYIDGLFSGSSDIISSDSTTRRINHINSPLMGLYYAAMPDSFRFANRIIFEVKDTKRYIMDAKKESDWVEWAKQNAYCYEITVPLDVSMERIKQLLLQDLNRNLDLNGRIENHLTHCLALVRASMQNDLLRSKGGIPIEQLYGSAKVKHLQNEPLSKLINALNNQIPAQSLKPVVIDETGYTGKIDLSLPIDTIDNISELRPALKKYGLDIVPVERRLPMLIITENGFKHTITHTATSVLIGH
jgi:thiol-disulfide isomerase/thioredoxin